MKKNRITHHQTFLVPTMYSVLSVCLRNPLQESGPCSRNCEPLDVCPAERPDEATEGKEAWFVGLTAPTWCSSTFTLSPPPSSPYHHPRKHTLDHHCKDTVPNPQGRRLHFTNTQQSRPPQGHKVYKATPWKLVHPGPLNFVFSRNHTSL